jgi:hypothetical protein
VLSAHHGGQPYASLAAFAGTSDLPFLYFVTPRTTRTFNNLQHDCRLALLITNSASRDTDFHETRGLLDLARASYRLRDDDNIQLGRIESQLMSAVAVGRRRLEIGRNRGRGPRGAKRRPGRPGLHPAAAVAFLFIFAWRVADGGLEM